MKNVTLMIVFMHCLCVCADTACIGAYVVDAVTQAPIPGIKVSASFSNDNGWEAWTESAPIYHDTQETDVNGFCTLKGKTNIGRAGCGVDRQGTKYYGAGGGGFHFTRKNIFGVWQPDNLVATIRLQRVERPIPLFVKRVEIRDYARGIGGFDGTNSVLRFDLVKGDWLPPYGKGEIADMTVRSQVEITGTGRFRRPYPEFGWATMDFYKLKNELSLSNADGIAEIMSNSKDGIRIRNVSKEPGECRVQSFLEVRQVFERNGKDWHTQNVKDRDPDRCYTFRIRTRRNEEGGLIEAYYGKIYGDFEFEGDDRKGLIGVKFLYYLNPTSLDRNLEWDMKTNLCPNPGDVPKEP